MSGSAIARRQARNHARYRGRNDLNIVPMIDVFVVLLFFLIFTAVFSKTSIVELNLPAASTEQPLDLPENLELEVVVRQQALVVQDKNTGPLKELPSGANGYDYAGLSTFLSRVKAQVPELRQATLLLEQDIPYDTIVQVMDVVRSFEGTLNGQPTRGELFPQIALGDAPLLAGGAP
jgi:biopolymer transport protein ExbD